ncbi:MAG TPA: hypothetical protein VGK73_28025, partial [Polyangiaceae bacterium]
MTQPAGPYPFAVQTGPVAPGPAAPPLAPQGIDWAAIQAQEQQAYEQERAQAQTATEDATREEARRAALREEIGVVDTVGTQAARGALDALLAPGALVGMFAQAAGEAYQNDAVARFGRDLGRAASGKSAIEALGFALGDVDRADQARLAIEKQEQARPTLAMVSKLAGTTAFGLSLGLGSTASKALPTIAANAAEGAAGGAQIAYESKEDLPLRDVLTASAIGGLLGGGLAAAGEG